MDSTVTVTVDGLVVGKATADAAGHWNVNSLYELAQGRHTMTATATDTVGRVSQASSVRTFTVEPKGEPQGCGCASSPAGGMASPRGLPSASRSETQRTARGAVVGAAGELDGTETAANDLPYQPA